MIAKKFKIGSKDTLAYILKKGRRVRGDFFQLRIILNTASHDRYAIVVSKKVSPKAVVRNKIRRRFYEAIRRNSEVLMRKKPCYDIVVLASTRATEAPYSAIEKKLIESLVHL